MLPSGLLATRALDLKGAVRRAPGHREGQARPAPPPGGDSGADAGPEGAGGADQPKGVQCGCAGRTAGGPGRAHCGLPTPSAWRSGPRTGPVLSTLHMTPLPVLVAAPRALGAV